MEKRTLIFSVIFITLALGALIACSLFFVDKLTNEAVQNPCKVCLTQNKLACTGTDGSFISYEKYEESSVKKDGEFPQGFYPE